MRRQAADHRHRSPWLRDGPPGGARRTFRPLTSSAQLQIDAKESVGLTFKNNYRLPREFATNRFAIEF
jgi:hypothetical protein